MGETIPARRAHRKRGPLWRWIVVRLTAVGLGVLVAALLAEVTLWVVGWPIVGTYYKGRGPIELEWPCTEGGAYREMVGRVRVLHYDYDQEYQINRDGFAEREPAPKAPGEYRIGVLGDSMSFGLGVPVEQRFTSIWQEQVRDKLPPGTSVWNLCSPSSGTLQQAEMLAGVGSTYELDEVVLCFFSGNDLDDNTVWVKLRAEAGSATPKVAARSSARLWLREHSRLASFLWIKAIRAVAKMRYVGSNVGTGFPASWPTTRDALGKFKEACGNRPLTVWYVPSIVEVNGDMWAALRGQLGTNDARRHQARDAVGAWCAENGVPMVDLTAPLQGKAYGDIQFPVDQHWNAKGHRTAAEWLAKQPGSAAALRMLGQ